MDGGVSKGKECVTEGTDKRFSAVNAKCQGFLKCRRIKLGTFWASERVFSNYFIAMHSIVVIQSYLHSKQVRCVATIYCRIV